MLTPKTRTLHTYGSVPLDTRRPRQRSASGSSSGVGPLKVSRRPSASVQSARKYQVREQGADVARRRGENKGGGGWITSIQSRQTRKRPLSYAYVTRVTVTRHSSQDTVMDPQNLDYINQLLDKDVELREVSYRQLFEELSPQTARLLRKSRTK